MSDIYVKTGRKGKVVRTMPFTKGGVMVNLDFNAEREVVGVEIIGSTGLTIDGKPIVEYLMT